MYRLTFTLLLLLLLPMPAIADSDDYIPRSDDRGFDVLHYDLDVEIDPSTASIAGSVVIRFSPLVDDLAVLHLDLVEQMTVNDVYLVTDGSSLVHVHAGDSLMVDLPPAAAGIETEVTVTWGGRPRRHGLLNAGLLYRTHATETPDPEDDAPAIFSVSQTWSAHSWWPCKDHPSDKSTARIAITAPKDLLAISNGSLDALEYPRPGWHRTVWVETHPIATYLISVALSDYERWDELCPCAEGPLPLAFFAFAEDLAKAKADLAPTCEMMLFLEELYGPYPFGGEKYATVEVPWAAAMENQTMTVIAKFNLTGNGYFENIVLHEMAHSWFGDALTPSKWTDIWVSEGFATYSEALWFERQLGREDFLDYMARMGPRNPSHDLFLGDGVLSDPSPILPNRLVYDKGAWVLHMLRGLIGDELFFDFVRSYATGPTRLHGNTSVEELTGVASAVAGRDLSDFFTPWLTTDLVPELDISLRQNPAGGTVEATVTQRQSPLFLFDLPLRLETAAGPQDFHLEIARRSETFTLPLGQAVSGFEIDPEGWLLYRSGQLEAPLLTCSPPAPNPATGTGTTLSFQLRASRRVHFAAYDLRGRRLDSRDLGVYPATDPMEPDGHSWHWDGRAKGGRLLPAGMYWVELSTDDRRAIHKVTLLR